tara:strand:- start:489 stop:674 length:186 start_codon:yes stop_codon:yes gene_type:complete
MTGLMASLWMSLNHHGVPATELTPTVSRETLRKNGATGDLCLIGKKADRLNRGQDQERDRK